MPAKRFIRREPVGGTHRPRWVRILTTVLPIYLALQLGATWLGGAITRTSVGSDPDTFEGVAALSPAATLAHALRDVPGPEGSGLRAEIRLGHAQRIEPKLVPATGSPLVQPGGLGASAGLIPAGELVDSTESLRLEFDTERMLYVVRELESGEAIGWLGEGPPPRRRRGRGRDRTPEAPTLPSPDDSATSLVVQGEPFAAVPTALWGAEDSEGHPILLAGGTSYLFDPDPPAILPVVELDEGTRWVTPPTRFPNFQAVLTDRALLLFEGDQPVQDGEPIRPRAAVPLSGEVADLVRLDLLQTSDRYLVAALYGTPEGIGRAAASLKVDQVVGRDAAPGFDPGPFRVEPLTSEALSHSTPEWVSGMGFLASPTLDWVRTAFTARSGLRLPGAWTLALAAVLSALSALILSLRFRSPGVGSGTRAVMTGLGAVGGPALAFALLARVRPGADATEPVGDEFITP